MRAQTLIVALYPLVHQLWDFSMVMFISLELIETPWHIENYIKPQFSMVIGWLDDKNSFTRYHF